VPGTSASSPRSAPASSRKVERTCEACGAALLPYQRRFCSNPCSASTRHGAANNRYNGGLSAVRDGRVLICCRDGSLITYARGVMAGHIGRLLRSDELVHHINGDRTDDRIENLEIVTRAEHMNMHRADLMAGRR
jgi:hypothetical protein